MPTESTIQCFIHPTGSLTVNRLKMVILLSGNTTWHGRRPTHTEALRHAQTHRMLRMSKEKRERGGEKTGVNDKMTVTEKE